MIPVCGDLRTQVTILGEQFQPPVHRRGVHAFGEELTLVPEVPIDHQLVLARIELVVDIVLCLVGLEHLGLGGIVRAPLRVRTLMHQLDSRLAFTIVERIRLVDMDEFAVPLRKRRIHLRIDNQPRLVEALKQQDDLRATGTRRQWRTPQKLDAHRDPVSGRLVAERQFLLFQLFIQQRIHLDLDASVQATIRHAAVEERRGGVSRIGRPLAWRTAIEAKGRAGPGRPAATVGPGIDASILRH